MEQEATLVTSRSISNVLAEFLGEGDKLIVEAIRRLCGSTLIGGVSTPSAAERLQAARHSGTALFAVERQNLFVDDAREAIIWCRMLKQMPKKGITRYLVNALSTWATEGLETLTSEASTQEDGPLGWASKQDVFVFGMQVIMTADVLLQWRRVSSKVPLRGSALRLSLWKLAEAGKTNCLHEMWLEVIHRVLRRSLLDRLCCIGRVLTHVEAKLLS